eukprot:NODE_1633_length_787_cov_83.915152_g1584_i0.p1 GENE.NODE_1633_length_787_cov_83.915152_g1584_i0~~NODE_1633_length_787_cov_83.915152_g1584_i0.p1  ORF type:complete len:225 (-),score=43.58 NODE_1633_length_787_cov_83.915152_g1584_i0:14-688(-)
MRGQIFLFLQTVVTVVVLASVVNIFMTSLKFGDSKTAAQLLNTDPAQATKEHLQALGKRDLQMLFETLKPPSKLNGEFELEPLRAGPVWFLGKFIYDQFFGPGACTGAGFKFEKGSGEGYLIFTSPDGQSTRSRRMEGYLVDSVYDQDSTMIMDFSKHNGFFYGDERLEIRQVNEQLLLAAAYNRWTFGPNNSVMIVLSATSEKFGEVTTQDEAVYVFNRRVDL